MLTKTLSYIQNNSVVLFKCQEAASLKALFDVKGFYLSDEAQKKYTESKNMPHLYVAYTKGKDGFYYIGKSFQKGGRWKRQHAYHLGTLAYHLLGTIRYDDQNHQHWIDNWMDINSKQVNNHSFFILLKEVVYIAFIPFENYSTYLISDLSMGEIRKINSNAEKILIEILKTKGFRLLNVQNNRKPVAV